MATILIVPHHWAADLNTSFALARKLERRGHGVCFLCVPDTAQRIRSQGFLFRPVFEAVYPPGSVNRQNDEEARGRHSGMAGFREKLDAMCDRLRRGEIDRAAEETAADALVVSSWMPWLAIAAQRTGLPIISFSSTPISVPDPIVPPFGSDLTPNGSSLFRLKCSLAWRRLFLARRFLNSSVDTAPVLRALAREFGYPPEAVDARVETWPRLSFPELVFCPETFDFPRERPPAGAHFVEASIEATRRDPSFPWHRLREGSPLIYCSLGSVVTFKFRPQAERLIQFFLDAVGSRPHWQGVAAVGRHANLRGFRCPENALIVAEAPQLDLLRRASLALTHGGLSGVKEAIFFGVPMVVVPFFYDQRGNAARVAYHGLGLRADLRTLTSDRLAAMMERVIEEPAFLARVRAMSRTFVELEERGAAADVVEGELSLSRSRKSAPDP